MIRQCFNGVPGPQPARSNCACCSSSGCSTAGRWQRSSWCRGGETEALPNYLARVDVSRMARGDSHV